MKRILVDSGCDLTEDMKNGTIDFELIPLNLQLGDKTYVDDRNLDMDQYIEDMENCPVAVRTSAPSPELFLDSYKKEGSVFVVTLTSKLSGTYSSAMLAKQMYLDEIGDKFIHVVDSLSACVGETVIALKLHECIKNNLSDSEIVEAASKFVSEMRTYFLLEKYQNLAKNGRVNPYLAKLASLLSIKIIGAAIDGEIEMVDKARGHKKAVVRLTEIMQKENLDFENRILGITHVKCLDRALELKEEILKKMKFKAVVICEAGGIATTYSERGGLVVSY